MKPLSRTLVLVCAFLFLGACQVRAAQVAPIESIAEPAPFGVSAPEVGVSEGVDAFRSSDVAAFPRTDAAAVDRLVIRTASLTLVVQDPARSVETISAMAEEMDGFVVSSSLSQASFGEPAVIASHAFITIRVPSPRFPEALRRLKEGVDEVRSESIAGDDVTQQYTDLESRLRNLEAAEAQLREIMESASRTEDVLQVFENLRRVREEIEVIKGQMQYFEESARLSAISIELLPDVAAQPLQIGSWKPEGTAKQAVETLIRSLQLVADSAIWLGICGVPAAVLIGLPTWAVARGLRRRRARKSGEPKPG